MPEPVKNVPQESKIQVNRVLIVEKVSQLHITYTYDIIYTLFVYAITIAVSCIASYFIQTSAACMYVAS